MKDNIILKGHITVQLFDENGNLKQYNEFDNLVVNAGKDYIIDRIQSNSAATASWVAIGAGATAAAAGDTTLQTELARGNGTTSQPTSTTARSIFTFGAGVGTGTVTEYGLLNAGSSGTLIGRVVTGSIAKQAADSLQVTYDVSVS